jgi:hypothetical protein
LLERLSSAGFIKQNATILLLASSFRHKAIVV